MTRDSVAVSPPPHFRVLAADGTISDTGPLKRRTAESPGIGAWAGQQPGGPMLGTVLVVILILMLIGAFPRWRHSSSWGYGPSGIVGLLLIVVLVLALTGRV
jgi:hypothetical protein